MGLSLAWLAFVLAFATHLVECHCSVVGAALMNFDLGA